MKNNACKTKYPEIYKNFAKYYESFKNGKNNADSYEKVMKNLIEETIKVSKKIQDKNLFAKLLITISPFKYLTEDIEFGLFYKR